MAGATPQPSLELQRQATRTSELCVVLGDQRGSWLGKPEHTAGRRNQNICQVEVTLSSFKLPEARLGVIEALRYLL